MGDYVPTSYANRFTSTASNVDIPPDAVPLEPNAAEAVGRLVAAAVSLGHWDGVADLLKPGPGPVHDDPEAVGRLVEYHVARGELRRARGVLDKARDEAERDRRARARREEIIRATGHCPPDLVELAEIVLDARTLGLLERFGIVTTEQLVARSADELRAIPYLGVRTYAGIVEGLDRARVKHSFA